MGGKMLAGRRCPLEEAETIGRRVIEALTGVTSRAELAGSVRRRRPEVGDVDIVIVPTGDIVAALVAAGMEEPTGGVQQLHLLVDGVQVDLALTQADRWGTAILHWTGSVAFNIACRRQAKRLGGTLSQHGIACADGMRTFTEEGDVLMHLGMAYRVPGER